MSKTVLSFYCDDTSPYAAPAEAFRTFLDFCSSEGVAGESSCILAIGGRERPLSQPSTDNERAFVAQVRRASECGIDTHMELMTHGGLYDFAAQRVPEGAIHEGLWLHEPGVPVTEYESYFERIIEEGEKVGVLFTGVTWPGCGCEACVQRYRELGEHGHRAVNPNVWSALLNLARRGKFRGPTVPCFIHPSEGDYAARLAAADGQYGVYDLIANAGDRFGIWENDPARVDADYYITADGASGRIVELVRSGAPYCIFYAHWQGLNPVSGVGWAAFVEVVRRVRQFLADQTVWLRPSEYTDLCHSQAER